MFQKGPGEGYMAAKADVLAIAPGARCALKEYGSIRGYVVTLNGQSIGSGGSARDAWNSALGRLRKSAADFSAVKKASHP